MIKRNFKIFDTLNHFKKLYEAVEDENQEGAGVPEDGEQPQDATEVPAEGGDAASDPSKQADPNAGIFISDNQKAEMAKMILDALMMTPPEPGTIPSNLMNVTTDNADEVIKYIQGLNALSAPLALNNDSDSNSMAGALKDI